jgi:hypothetical protein
MTEDEAKEILLLHSFSHPNSANDPRAETGFLGSLRPYYGTLNVENYHAVMNALRALAPKLRASEELDREVVSALWGICHLALAWGVHPDGMLRRNNLIAEADVLTLAGWVQDISYATMCLLEGSELEVAFEGRDEDS